MRGCPDVWAIFCVFFWQARSKICGNEGTGKKLTDSYLRDCRFIFISVILPKNNIAPGNGWLEDEISLWDGLFSSAILVSGGSTLTVGD